MPETVDQAHFRLVMAQVPTCVTVVTAMVDGNPQAMVIGSFVSVSLDPPLAGFFCTTTSDTWQQLRRAEVLGVNVLAAEQIDVSNACMRAPEERFVGLDWEIFDGAPRIAGTAAWMTLRFSTISDAGDHEFALCEVGTMDVPAQPLSPLVFYGGRYRSLAAEADEEE